MRWLLAFGAAAALAGGPGVAWGQDFRLRETIDTPAAGLLPRGSYLLGLRVTPGGGLLGTMEVGLLERLELGLSYGGDNVVGVGRVDWNPHVAINAKYRLLDETVALPGLALGYDSQGFGRFSSALDRYETKSRGVYVVLSKNYRFLGDFGLHAGMNISLEGRDADEREPNFFLGMNKSINPDLTLLAEYDLPISTDETAKALDTGEGFLNAGVRYLVDPNLFLEVDFRNLNENARDSDRTIRIVYQSAF